MKRHCIAVSDAFAPNGLEGCTLSATPDPKLTSTPSMKGRVSEAKSIGRIFLPSFFRRGSEMSTS